MATTIPARHAAHAVLHANQHIRIANPSGHQVVDVWAFPLPSTTPTAPTWMSMSQSRSKLQKIIPEVNDTFVDTHRRPVLTLVQDTSRGTHDMLFPACDGWRYEEAAGAAGGAEGEGRGHASCAGNLLGEMAQFTGRRQGRGDGDAQAALGELEDRVRRWGWTPEPLNLFMNVPVRGGRLSVESPGGKEGDCVVLRAEVECLVVMSACPNDVADTNAGSPGDAVYEVLT
ncbi:hypothetical protein K505DRAFT_345031 [Melanomma pulvis-pyrius CBS 109.77]|uniref:DUF1989 domain-containing protein n=1 Tax=Melanomma pulvis-pyrius CBS 109.77 TaxID=1314802 RepID=A0A6A6XVP8_9PLEO|nr:hypothetical protein K505DRAFT_345031 [Melanomma pulvis-pyrius CBS 109.77]